MNAAQQIILFNSSAAFSPAAISGLVFAVAPDTGVSTDVNGVTAVLPAWGTAVGVTASGTNEPDVATGLGPANQNLFQHTKGRTEFFTISSAVVTGACTIAAVIGLGSTTANGNFLGAATGTKGQVRFSTGNPVTSLGVRATGGTIQTMTMSPGMNKMLNIFVLTYDGVDTAIAYINGVQVGTVSGLGNGGMNFDQIGVTASSTGPFDGFLGPLLIYNRVLTAAEQTQIVTFLAPWRGSAIYVANAGSNTATTPWNQTTPYQTLATALGVVLYGDETVAPKGGDLFRLTGATNTTVAGQSTTTKVKFNGALWGSGKAKIRGSVAPTLTVQTGTIYKSSVLAAKPDTFAYYLPGGTITFGSNFALGSMKRLTENTGTPTTPGNGEWGWDGVNAAYFNAGTAMTTGDIEVALTGVVGRVTAGAAKQAFSNIIVAFVSGTGFPTSLDNISADGLEVYFTTADGIDCGVSSASLNFQVTNSIVAWVGNGSTSLGASAGDGYSVHDISTATMANCQAWYCDKSGFDHHNDATTTMDRCIAVGSAPFNILDHAPGGTTTITNSIAIPINGATNAFGISSASTTTAVTVENCTVYSQSSPAAGSGIIQNGANGSLVAKNNIVKGFATGLNFTAGGTLTADHNDYSGNTANYGGGASAATGDITSDPLLTNPVGYDFTLQAASPCKRAGVTIPSVPVDYTGANRSSPPSIGAYE